MSMDTGKDPKGAPNKDSTPADGDAERNRLAGRVARYAKVGTGVGGIAAKMMGSRFFGMEIDRGRNSAELAKALGGLKGPIMKVAQLLATIPDALPPEYAGELMALQADAPPMGWPFVRRRMQAELGAGWQDQFRSFERKPAAAASLGQVHRAVDRRGKVLACKLQYPDMASAVEADLAQLNMIFAIHARMDPAIDTSEIRREIGERVREELDYAREARHMALYRDILGRHDAIRVPGWRPDLSTGRLLSMDWLEGRRLLDFKAAPLEDRNRLATAMFKAWWHPFSRYGVIHGDPHLGNYTVFEEEGRPGGINLLDYGCIRIFPPRFVGGVVELYQGLRANNRDQIVGAYETWGFTGLSNDLIDALNIWALFIYGPLLEDRIRSIAGDVSPADYGRKQAFQVHRTLKEKGPVTIPREFVFMDRAAIGLGSVFLHLKAELNFYQLYNEEIQAFSLESITERQAGALARAELEPA